MQPCGLLTAAHCESRLMLLGSPPDMVRRSPLRRAERTGLHNITHAVFHYITPESKLQEKNLGKRRVFTKMSEWISEAGEAAARCLENLGRRGFRARWFPDRAACAAALLAEIGTDEVVGIGGSKTIDELGVYDALVERGNTVWWHWKARPEDGDVRPKALLSDVFLCSANALMESGEPVSIDGGGNRVAAMFYGPKRCFIVCGVNKLAPDYDAAIERIKTVACPKNAVRLNMKTPCAKTGRCHECAAELRMCRVTVRYSYPMVGRETHVWLVGEERGF